VSPFAAVAPFVLPVGQELPHFGTAIPVLDPLQVLTHVVLQDLTDLLVLAVAV